MFHFAGKAGSGPLMSNVRPHQMPTDLPTALARFTSPHDVEHLRMLEEAVARIDSKKMTEADFRAVFDLYERFPDEDGYGIFWSFLHAVEAAEGYESALLESVDRKPVEFNVMMVGRFLNGGVAELDGRNLSTLLNAVATRADISSRAQETAKSFLAHKALREA
jgi:hypothetical protein